MDNCTKQAQREYYKNYRSENKDKIRNIQKSYWERKAKNIMEEQTKNIDGVINTVYESNNYEKFKLIKANRNISLSNLRNLDKSISKKHLQVPITINENFEIIDGQHRFIILKEKGLPITYIINAGYGIKECELLNTASKKWTCDDFLNRYCEEGNSNYIELKKFMEETKLTLSNARNFFELQSNDGRTAQIFNEGEFVIKDLEKTYKFYGQYLDFKEVEPFKSSLFIRSLMTIFNNKDYNHERMVQKLKYLGYKIKIRSFMSEYQEIITEVYNYKVKEQDKVYFR